MVIGYNAGQSNGVPLTVESGETKEVSSTNDLATAPTPTPVTVGSIGGVSSYGYDNLNNLIYGLVAIIVFVIVVKCLSLFVDVVGKSFK